MRVGVAPRSVRLAREREHLAREREHFGGVSARVGSARVRYWVVRRVADTQSGRLVTATARCAGVLASSNRMRAELIELRTGDATQSTR